MGGDKVKRGRGESQKERTRVKKNPEFMVSHNSALLFAKLQHPSKDKENEKRNMDEPEKVFASLCFTEKNMIPSGQF